MEREELKELVNKSLGSTQLKLSERTINEELDDVLGDFGDNEEANAKLVERVANRLKRIDGNLHADVSKEVKEYKENAEKKQKEGNEGGSKKNENNEGSESEIMKELKNLRAELDEERNARKQEQTERAKHATMDSVRKGLREKFENAGLKINDFFAKSALSKLEIPSENVDLKSLVEKAERLYNADIKEAGIEIGKPHAGGNGGGKEEKEDWSDVSGIVGRHNPKTE
jgi:hypothetical protein|nr:MAG TPA: hypothetical protein [Caudoviricetes sp.]